VGESIGLAEALLGLDGFRVLDVTETDAELVVRVETMAEVAGCLECGVRAEAQDRLTVEYRDLPCFGRPTRLVWWKRRWRCRQDDCEAKTWTEVAASFSQRAVLTARAGWDACRQVGQNARPVAQLARELGVCWDTVMTAVVEHGQPLVDDSARVGDVAKLGVDETAFLTAKRRHPTKYVTGMVDLDRRILIDLIEGNTAADLGEWLESQPPEWVKGVKVVAADLADSYRAATRKHLPDAVRVADPFHVVRVGNRCLDKVRRRVQNETLGHRGRKDDPLYKIRKIMLTGAERLDDTGRARMLLGLRAGDPNDEVAGAWLAKESVRDLYLTADPKDAELLLDKTVAGCLADEVAEIQSLGATLKQWRSEILNHHQTGASNGPTEALNLNVKRIKRCGRGFRNFDNYRLRVLLHTGGVNWPQTRPPTPRLRTRTPHSNE